MTKKDVEIKLKGGLEARPVALIVQTASLDAFPEVSGEDGDYLRLFTYICYLSYYIFIKKLLVEQLIDEVRNKEILREQKHKNKGDKKK